MFYYFIAFLVLHLHVQKAFHFRDFGPLFPQQRKTETSAEISVFLFLHCINATGHCCRELSKLVRQTNGRVGAAAQRGDLVFAQGHAIQPTLDWNPDCATAIRNLATNFLTKIGFLSNLVCMCILLEHIIFSLQFGTAVLTPEQLKRQCPRGASFSEAVSRHSWH